MMDSHREHPVSPNLNQDTDKGNIMMNATAASEEIDEENYVEEEDMKDDVEEAQAAEAIRVPLTPSKREIEEHELTHLPPRSWCVHCQAGRGKENHHRGRSDEEKEEIDEGAITTISMDYFYLNNKSDRTIEVDSLGEDCNNTFVLAVYDRTIKRRTSS